MNSTYQRTRSSIDSVVQRAEERYKKAVQTLPDYVTLDYKRARYVARRFTEIFSEQDLQSKIPELKYASQFKGAPKKHRRFLIIACAQNARKPSDSVYEAALRLMTDFSYEEMLDMTKRNERELDNVAGKYFGLTKEKIEGKKLKSSLLAIEQHKGDPINIFSDTDNVEIVRRRLRGECGGIYGVGRNISSLIVKNFVRFGYFSPDDQFDLPIKIDRHAAFLSVANNVIKFVNPTPSTGFHRERLEKALEATYRLICVKDRLNPILLDDAKWAIGSQLCDAGDGQCTKTCKLGCTQKFDIDRGTYYIWPSEQD